MVTLGDGICDLELNTDDCRNDYGDCCEQDSGEICEEILDIGLDYSYDYSKDNESENYSNQFISISNSSLIEYHTTNQYTHPCKCRIENVSKQDFKKKSLVRNYASVYTFKAQIGILDS